MIRGGQRTTGGSLIVHVFRIDWFDLAVQQTLSLLQSILKEINPEYSLEGLKLKL